MFDDNGKQEKKINTNLFFDEKTIPIQKKKVPMGVAASSLLRPVGSKQYYQREEALLESLSRDVSRLEVRR